MPAPAAARALAPIVVVMGVSAAGKTTIATGLAERLAIPWRDADDLHPEGNRARMAAGTPLTDDDRWPWLDTVGGVLAEAACQEGVVMACSALRRSYRDRLRASCPTITFVHLSGSRSVLAARAARRQDHFMPPSLLDSQLATLEALDVDERGCVVDVGGTVADIVEEAQEWIASNDQ